MGIDMEETVGQEQGQQDGESTQDDNDTASRQAEREQNKQLDEGTENPG
jgi:hypothetical protein